MPGALQTKKPACAKVLWQQTVAPLLEPRQEGESYELSTAGGRAGCRGPRSQSEETLLGDR